MDTLPPQITESALSLPSTQRAALATQLLNSLELPGEVVDAEQYGQQLIDRVEEYRRGEVASLSLDEARLAIKQKLRKEADH